VLPAIALSLPLAALLGQVLRDGLEEALLQPFALTVRTRGVSETQLRLRHALRHAALEGIGVVQMPTMVVSDDIRAGRLVEVLPDWAPRAGIIHAVFPSRRGLLPSVRALLDFLAADYARLDQEMR